MGVFHQMGAGSVSLLNSPRFPWYQGEILSPVNYSERDIRRQIDGRALGYQQIFDPQLYFPRSSRGELVNWAHYPKDVDTADLSSREWWISRVEELAAVVERLQPASVCSPSIAPRTFGPGYYSLTLEVAEELRRLVPRDIEVLPTIIVNLRDLASRDRLMETASIVAKSSASRLYLILWADVDPRREVSEWEDIAGGMRLIRLLEGADYRLLVGFSSSDMLLWKAAGATDCATGKYFNLRRFTPSRWDPPAAGGGQLPYWFEESVMAFIREADVLHLKQLQKLSPASISNPFCNECLTNITSSPPKPWIAEAWRQYMYWFQDAERRISHGELSVEQSLVDAENTWSFLRNNDVFLEEPMNDGRWVARWRQALAAFASS